MTLNSFQIPNESDYLWLRKIKSYYLKDTAAQTFDEFVTCSSGSFRAIVQAGC